MSSMKQYQSASTTRLRRLIALLTILQTKRIVNATDVATRFNISTRTVYRDIKLLEEAGVPVFTEEGKGFSLVDGYKVPPLLFTESEAAAVITAEKFIAGNNDQSLVNNYHSATDKIKAVLRYMEKEKMNMLSERVKVYSNDDEKPMTSHFAELQHALTDYKLIRIQYCALKEDEITDRIVEPFALFYAANKWLLLAFCRLRNDYRFFRIDRFRSFQILSEKFEPHKMTITQYLDGLSEDTIRP
ncbi:MAG: WYL domain-containing protein [Mucilaginibacter sp.]